MKLDNKLVMTGLQAGLGALAGMTAKNERNRAGLAANFGASLLMNVLTYRLGQQVAFAALRARPVPSEESPRLHRIVEKMAERAGMRKPAVYRMGIPKPNAFATGTDPDHAVVGVSDALLKLLDDDEVAAVVAHELGHIQNRDRLHAAIGAFAASVATLGAAFLRTTRESGDSKKAGRWREGLAVASMAAGLFLTLHRTRCSENDADLAGARICGRPGAMISALEKLRNWKPEEGAEAADPGHSSASPFSALLLRLLSLVNLHPSMDERIRRLRKMA